MRGDLMTPNLFWSVTHSMPYWGIFLFQIWFYRSSRSCVFIPTYRVCAEMMMFSLFYDDPLVEPQWSHSFRSALLDIGLLSCFLFRETFPRCLDLIWIIDITCLMIDDSISPGFRLIVHLMPHWGIFPFWMRFRDLHGVTWSFPFTEYTLRWWFVCYFMMIPQWSLSGVIQLGTHFSALRCHQAPPPRYTS